jgi:serine/threonine-protein kinase
MGMVFCARERTLEQRVAIKALVPDVALTADARERFLREARVGASLSHPSIVPVFAYGETRTPPRIPFLIMPFVRGESLGRRLRHERTLAADVVRRVLIDVADALDHAHARNVIHRDLKPENVLIAAETGRAMLVDFGIAKALGDGRSLTNSRVAIGTPEYMSPEQTAGRRDIDGRSDLYSLGALGYTMLAGRPPHQGDGVSDVMTKILTEDPVPIRELAPEAPQDLVAAITRCLEKNPDRRWPDARSLSRALAREASEDDLTEDLRAVTGFGAFVLLVLLVAAAWGFRGWMTGDVVGMVIPPLAGLLVAVGFVNYARGIAASGDTLGDVLRVSMWPPKWWGLWWPPRLRRRGDMWECLPMSARLTRAYLTLMFAAILAWLVVRSSLNEAVRGRGDQAVLTALAVGTLVVVSGLLWWSRLDFSLRDASRLLFGPTVGATFWNQPHVNSVLITRPDAGATCATPLPATVRAMLHAIEESAARLSGQARELGSGAVAAAQSLVSDIERLDDEIQQIAHAPEQLALAQQSLDALRETQRDARQHLESYIKLMRRDADRLEMKRLEREDANGMLRAMWALLERLRDQSGRGTADVALLEQVRAMIADVRKRN